MGRGTMSPSSISAAVMAETVVGDRSVRSQISMRAMGPCRRIASITWKRLIALINSGSAVFMECEGRGYLFPDAAFL